MGYVVVHEQMGPRREAHGDGKQTAACRWSIMVCAPFTGPSTVCFHSLWCFSLFRVPASSVDHCVVVARIHCFNGHRLIVSPSVWRQLARARMILFHVLSATRGHRGRMNCKMGERERAQTAFLNDIMSTIVVCWCVDRSACGQMNNNKINKHYHALGIRTFCFCSFLYTIFARTSSKAADFVSCGSYYFIFIFGLCSN